MDELTDIYKRIEYLRNNGVKMKEIADRVDMAPSVATLLSSCWGKRRRSLCRRCIIIAVCILVTVCRLLRIA